MTSPRDDRGDLRAGSGCRSRAGDDFVVTPPSYRFDLAIEEDFVEEIARLHGYDDDPRAPVRARAARCCRQPEGVRAAVALRRRLVDARLPGGDHLQLRQLGDWERAASDAATPSPITVLNPIASHLDVMRTTLLGGLLDVLRTNLDRKHGARARVRDRPLLPARRRRRDDQPLRHRRPRVRRRAARAVGRARKRAVDFFDVKGDVEALAAPRALDLRGARPIRRCIPAARRACWSTASAVGWLGELHPRSPSTTSCRRRRSSSSSTSPRCSASRLPAAQPVSRLPVVRRDFAVVVDEDVPAQALLDALDAAQPPQVDAFGCSTSIAAPALRPARKALRFWCLCRILNVL